MSILIKNAKIVDVKGTRKGSILIEDDKIVKIGDIREDEGDKIIDASDKLVIPGLINTHTHLSMTLFRGIADDLQLHKWLENYIWPLEKHLNEDYCYAGALLGCIEMIKSGTTAFNDMYFYMDSVAKAIEKCGLRAVISHGMIDLNNEDKMKKEIKESKRIVKKCHGMADGRISVALGPHSPYTCSEKLLKKTSKYANKNNLKIHIHVSETREEIKTIKERYGMRPFEYLDDIGFLGENVIAAHAVWLSEEEIKIIKNNNVKISHNPVSNMKLASGISPVSKMLDENITVSLGTDGAASNNNLDMLEEMKIAALLQKVHYLDPTKLSAKDVFAMATINGAKTLGINAGLIEVGKKADLVLINVKRCNLTPFRNPISHLVYSANGYNVTTVIVDGKILMEDNVVQVINEKEVMEIAENASDELLSKS
ncbi:amidohydrolase [Methanothermus fervidus DSM 2088]|uniref:5'-deoxyadenosine deaminase n=1 Tax=Methanothermus fervidus (strain ATCC 43054 / DSM 2088 / JCM 10308 / V24 S) TaxID=523846 RepID=E3GYX2_METFV|nr:amidohydrolase [Methanothermus fervidus DSM 2088]